jgi:hypothetical protein
MRCDLVPIQAGTKELASAAMLAASRVCGHDVREEPKAKSWVYWQQEVQKLDQLVSGVWDRDIADPSKSRFGVTDKPFLTGNSLDRGGIRHIPLWERSRAKVIVCASIAKTLGVGVSSLLRSCWLGAAADQS